jgi:hypothetical protein
VISSVAEFDDATVFERWALQALVPLPTARPHSSIKDIGNNAVRVAAETAVAVEYAGGVRKVDVDLRPLAFGTAWKVVDLLIELALAQSGLGTNGRLSITRKVREARTAAGVCPPLSTDRVLWAALTSAYAGTAEIRNSLVHRTAEVDKVTGRLTGRDDQGGPLSPVSADAQEAFCRAAQRAAQAVIARESSPRERSDLAWNLDQIVGIHGQQPIGGKRMHTAPLAIAPVQMSGAAVVVNPPALLAELRRNFPGRTAYDASFRLPDGQHLLVELEHAPQAEVAVDPAAPPAWATLWNGPG